MKISSIKQQVKNDNRVSIFLDGKYTFSLTHDQLLQEKLKKDIELNDIEVERLKKLSDEGKLKQRALEWVLLRQHSEREFREYLYKKKVDKDLMDYWVEEFREKQYLNDESFALWFAQVRRRKNKSNRAIFAELSAKGVDRSIIQNVIDNLEHDNSSALILLLQKVRSRPRYSDEKKLISYLISKGFSYSEIKKALND